ncbi:MAG: phytoene desaturase [Bacteroidetes bacterium]|nr:phytoene desaturase [Bacteroidota bacterium]
MSRIVVIGSGFGGMGSALRLLAQGHEVTILEKLDKPGGRAYVFEQDGYKFDAGPTVITAPWLIHELFELFGKDSAKYVRIVPVHPFYRIYFHDRSFFEYNNEPGFIEENIRKFNPADVDGYRAFMRKTKPIFEKGFIELADKPFLTIGSMLKVVPDLVKLGSYRSVYSYVSKFISDPRLRMVFTFHPLLVGGNPFHTTSIYSMIHYLEKEWGVHYAMGGTGEVIRAFAQLFEEEGGVLRLNAEVESIDVENRRAKGVRLKDGSFIQADAVVSNADIAYTYLNMIDRVQRKKYTDRKLQGMRYSMSLFVVYFGTTRQYPGIAHHDIILSHRYRELLEDIFTRKVLADDFSLYLHRPTATDPSMAPEGGDAFYALVPVPHNASGINWTQEGPRFKERIFDFLEANYLPALRAHLATERIFTPDDFETRLNSYLGSAFSVEPVLTQSAWFRPHNRSEDVENLYFTGAGTHPGAGLPGVLSSSKIVEKLIGPAKVKTI